MKSQHISYSGILSLGLFSLNRLLSREESKIRDVKKKKQLNIKGK